ncbi:MAG: beta galactosidase jelly roll domain-containing protein [Dysgonamonadaceae bacterium]|jgi:sialate O-acetylesterase|nr:beta galactosidase jelly roll domain-containing protein [Dysgonamonadaceae bacterium]
MKIKQRITILFISLFAGVSGQIRLPKLISDGMILQRDVPVKIWGWAAPNETVNLDFNNMKYTATANDQGEWEMQLPSQIAGGPYSMTLNASNTVTVKNILFGDVWLCSGQSNMETPVSRVTALFNDEIRNYSNPEIRYVKIPMTFNFHAPQTDVPPCHWVELTPETALQFSAVAYFFAKEMYEATGIPAGIINSSVGGSPAEAWISEEALKPFPACINEKRICESDEFVSEMLHSNTLSMQRWLTVLNEQDSGLNETAKWYSPDYDDNFWQTSDLFDNRWGKSGNRPVNGVFWFRKTIEIPQKYENHPAMLYLGRIVDADSVFVNGAFVGTTGYQYPPRNYSIPAAILKAGKNNITVRLVSQFGFPEFVPDKPYKIVFSDKEISLEGQWKYRAGTIMPPTPAGITFQYKPTGLYNAMIAPLKNHALKGILWYQGESNTGRYNEYFDLITTLVNDWRRLWKKNLPFLAVQLTNFMEPALLQQNSDWAELRDIQRELYQTIPNTGMAVAIDLGEWNDIHPLNKKDVGKRLALQARKLAYGEKIVSEGPAYQSKTIKNNTVILSFKEGNGDFMPVAELKGFAIAGADGIFHPANARIEGKQIVVWNETIAQPVKVRYAWANNPEGANLKNTAGLPASPFQTE